MNWQLFSPFRTTQNLVSVSDFPTRNTRGGYRSMSPPIAGFLLSRSTSIRDIFVTKTVCVNGFCSYI